MIDHEIVNRLIDWNVDDLRVLVLPDHPTPVAVQTHTSDPVPYVMWGKGIAHNGAKRFTETAAKSTGIFWADGYNVMDKFLRS
jgi:2,3-bisphosphoglycerate-independent phosphoglycerate mutase